VLLLFGIPLLYRGIFVLLVGVGKEIYDYVDYGLFSLLDITYDIVGIIYAMTLVVILRKIFSIVRIE